MQKTSFFVVSLFTLFLFASSSCNDSPESRDSRSSASESEGKATKHSENEKTGELEFLEEPTVLDFGGCKRDAAEFKSVAYGCKNVVYGMVISRKLKINATFADGIKFCEDHNAAKLGGYSDWRMPKYDDFLIPDLTKTDSARYAALKLKMFDPLNVEEQNYYIKQARFNPPFTTVFWVSDNYPFLADLTPAQRANSHYGSTFRGSLTPVLNIPTQEATCVRYDAPLGPQGSSFNIVGRVDVDSITNSLIKIKIKPHLYSDTSTVGRVLLYDDNAYVLSAPQTLGTISASPLYFAEANANSTIFYDEYNRTISFSQDRFQGRKIYLKGAFDRPTNTFIKVDSIKIAREDVIGGCGVETPRFKTSNYGCEDTSSSGLTWFTSFGLISSDMYNAANFKFFPEATSELIGRLPYGKAPVAILTKDKPISYRPHARMDYHDQIGLEPNFLGINGDPIRDIDSVYATSTLFANNPLVKLQRIPERFCQSLNNAKANGITSWRLPTVEEIKAIAGANNVAREAVAPQGFYLRKRVQFHAQPYNSASEPSGVVGRFVDLDTGEAGEDRDDFLTNLKTLFPAVSIPINTNKPSNFPNDGANAQIVCVSTQKAGNAVGTAPGEPPAEPNQLKPVFSDDFNRANTSTFPATLSKIGNVVVSGNALRTGAEGAHWLVYNAQKVADGIVTVKYDLNGAGAPGYFELIQRMTLGGAYYSVRVIGLTVQLIFNSGEYSTVLSQKNISKYSGVLVFKVVDNLLTAVIDDVIILSHQHLRLPEAGFAGVRFDGFPSPIVDDLKIDMLKVGDFGADFLAAQRNFGAPTPAPVPTTINNPEIGKCFVEISTPCRTNLNPTFLLGNRPTVEQPDTVFGPGSGSTGTNQANCLKRAQEVYNQCRGATTGPPIVRARFGATNAISRVSRSGISR